MTERGTNIGAVGEEVGNALFVPGARIDLEQRADLKNALFRAIVEAEQLPRTSDGNATIFNIEGFADHINAAIAPFLLPNTPLVDLELPTNVSLPSYRRDQRYDREVLRKLGNLRPLKESYGRGMASMRQLRVFTVGALHQVAPRTEVQARYASVLKPAFALPVSTQ